MGGRSWRLCIKMPDVMRELEIPEGIDVSVSDSTVSVKGPKGQLTRTFKLSKVQIRKDQNKIIISSDISRRSQKAMVGTVFSHIKNMIKGVDKGYVYKLRALHAHFPMSLKVKDSRFVVENFLGSRDIIAVSLPADVKVEVKANEIIVSGIDKELVAQTSARIEQSTRLPLKDRRVFQDGIYLVERNGVPV